MAKTNKDKDLKDPILEEIEQDETPLDDSGKPVDAPVTPSVEDLLAKDPSELTAAEIDILSENKDDLTDEQKVAVGLMDPEVLDGKKEEDDEEEIEEEVVTPKKKEVPKEEGETPEEKERRYKAQQAEAQIQIEKSRKINEDIAKAEQLPPPTEDELRAFVKADGADWDELTTYEQSMAKKNLINERELNAIKGAFKTAQKVDEWAGQVDGFIDETDGKPEFVKLSGHEAEFRKYAMKESHRGVDIQMLLNSFLYTLPEDKKTRGSLFNRGGGERQERPKEGISDADYAANLRVKDPREYARQVKAGKIKIEI